jgi:hypothetical protein
MLSCLQSTSYSTPTGMGSEQLFSENLRDRCRAKAHKHDSRGRQALFQLPLDCITSDPSVTQLLSSQFSWASESIHDLRTGFIEVVELWRLTRIASWTTTLTLPKGSGNFFESQLGQEIKRDEDIVSGTIGTPLCNATWRTPFLRTRAGP